ncbi:MAG: hypothetical protein Q9175_001053 [Cornicularia normoerica]
MTHFLTQHSTAQRTITCSKPIIAAGLRSASVPINIKGSEKFTAPIVNFGDYAHKAPQIYEVSFIVDLTVLGGDKAAYDTVYLMGTHGKPGDLDHPSLRPWPNIYVASTCLHRPFWMLAREAKRNMVSTWLSPCVWGDADGFGFVRNLLHGTSWGRWFVDTFWAKMAFDTLEQSGILKSEATKNLVPEQSMF